MDETTFRYSTACSSPGCAEPPRFKIAARWSYGPLRELKNYALSCETHRDDCLARARIQREGLSVGLDEVVGPVEVFDLTASSDSP